MDRREKDLPLSLALAHCPLIATDVFCGTPVRNSLRIPLESSYWMLSTIRSLCLRQSFIQGLVCEG